jgi:hypothetical protein
MIAAISKNTSTPRYALRSVRTERRIFKKILTSKPFVVSLWFDQLLWFLRLFLGVERASVEGHRQASAI